MYNFSYSMNIFWIWWTSIQELFWKMTNTFLIQWTLFEFDENFLKTVKNNNLMNICLVRWANLNCDEHFLNLMNQKLSPMNIICILEHFFTWLNIFWMKWTKICSWIWKEKMWKKWKVKEEKIEKKKENSNIIKRKLKKKINKLGKKKWNRKTGREKKDFGFPKPMENKPQNGPAIRAV